MSSPSDPAENTLAVASSRASSARVSDGLHDEALTSRGPGKPLVEGHDVQRGRQSLRGDDGSGKLQRVGAAKRVHSKESACNASQGRSRLHLIPGLGKTV